MRLVALGILYILALAPEAAAQTAWQPMNLRYFPRDMPRTEFLQQMREFSFALGVRCTYCHDADDTKPFDQAAYASDGKAAKAKALAMLKMVDDINRSLLARIPDRATPAVTVTCATCHHGLALPKSLQTTLFETIQREGVAAGIARYRELRRTEMGSGRYNFGQWEINELARRLGEAGRIDDAIAVYDLNAEFYPESASIEFLVGELELERGHKDAAIARYRATLRKSPDHSGALRRLKELEGR